MNANYEHEILVQTFLEEKRLEDPRRYKEISEKYPVQDRARSFIIKRRELPVGLLGLSPSRVSIETASKGDLESIYMKREEG